MSTITSHVLAAAAFLLRLVASVLENMSLPGYRPGGHEEQALLIAVGHGPQASPADSAGAIADMHPARPMGGPACPKVKAAKVRAAASHAEAPDPRVPEGCDLQIASVLSHACLML
jgi:hypothetical protein